MASKSHQMSEDAASLVLGQVSSGYNHQSRGEAQIGCWKMVIGPKLKPRNFLNQKTEVRIGTNILNKMNGLRHIHATLLDLTPFKTPGPDKVRRGLEAGNLPTPSGLLARPAALSSIRPCRCSLGLQAALANHEGLAQIQTGAVQKTALLPAGMLHLDIKNIGNPMSSDHYLSDDLSNMKIFFRKYYDAINASEGGDAKNLIALLELAVQRRSNLSESGRPGHANERIDDRRSLAVDDANWLFSLAQKGSAEALDVLKNFEITADVFLQIGARYSSWGAEIEAAVFAIEAVVKDSTHIDALEFLANTLEKLQEKRLAVKVLLFAISIKKRESTLIKCALLHSDIGDFRMSHNLLREARLLNPNNTYAEIYLDIINSKLCIWEDIEGARRRASRLPSPDVHGSLTLDGSADGSLRRSQFAARLHRGKKRTRVENFKNRNGKIVIGYFSGDFCDHVMMRVLEKVFAKHDKSVFHLVAFYTGPTVKDEVTKRISSIFDEFYECGQYNEKRLAEFSRSKEVDIAVDLSGYTKGGKPGAFFLGVAPVQVNFIGYPGSMGSKAYDYIVVDHYLVPKNLERFYSEECIFLPSSYMPAVILEDLNRVERDTQVVLCCLNNNYKISPEALNLWLDVVAQNENAEIWLLDSGTHIKEAVEKYASRFDNVMGQIKFVCKSGYHEYLEVLSSADIFLDTFHYNAGATACDSLSVGTPIITMAGTGYTERMCASMLKAIDLEDLIVSSQAEYRAVLERFIQSRDFRNKIFNKLQTSRKHNCFFDIVKYVNNLEKSFFEVHQRAKVGKTPISIEVEDLPDIVRDPLGIFGKNQKNDKSNLLLDFSNISGIKW